MSTKNYVECTFLDDGRIIAIGDEVPSNLWISVKDRLPEYNKVVLCWNGKAVWPGYYVCGEYIGWLYLSSCGSPEYGKKATHWQPLPEPPENK